jgi:hypothetical protein
MDKTHRDWLPQARSKKYEMVTEVTVPYLNANLTRFGMDDVTPLGKWYKQEFSVKGYNLYVMAYAGWVNPETRAPIAIVAMREAEKVFILYYRELYRLLRANPLVTNADLEAMGFPTRTVGRRRLPPVATDAPEFGVTPLSGLRLRIDYYPSGSTRRKGKPKGQHGAEIRWMFSGTPVADPSALHNSVFSVASPAILTFSGDDQGRALYLAIRWENTRGEKGPWSHVELCYVP